MCGENNEKLGFFKRVYLAITDFDKYGLFASESIGTAIGYLLKIILILALTISAMFIYQFHNNLQETIEYFKENISQIQYKDGILQVNQGEKIELHNENAILPYIIIHTSANEQEVEKYENDLNSYETGLLILNDRVIYKNELLSQNMKYDYSYIAENYKLEEFNKQDVLNAISQTNLSYLYITVFIVMFICSYILYLSSTFVDIVMLGVLGFIIARISGMKIRFKATFNIGIYALTLSILLNVVYAVINGLTGFSIQYFQWMYTTISYIYVIVAILMIKADFINKQAELMKIIEEQEKVRQEMILKEEQKKQEEEKNQNKDNKDKKEDEEDKNQEPKKRKSKDKKEDLGTDGLAPQEVRKLQE